MTTMEGEPEAYVDESLRSIGISPRERLARIEAILTAIDGKLDSKANQVDLLALEVRVREIEVKGSKASHEALAEARRLAAERLEDQKNLEKEYHELRKDHEELGKRMAYALGGVAVIAVFAEYLLSHLNV